MGPSDRNVLEVQGLTVRFDTSERSVVAVKDLGFHVRAGEVLAIVGESGSGKSVTSLSVMRLIEHGGGTIASGKISFTRRNGGKLDLAKAADSVMRTIRGGEISMIFQEPMTSLNPVFSVGTELFCLDTDTYLMDTPGFSSMFVEDMEPQELKEYFPEFAPFEDECKFLGCVHIGEKICGVKQAVEQGKISKSRYENYRLFYQELKEKRRYTR